MRRLPGLLLVILLAPALVAAADRKDDHKSTDTPKLRPGATPLYVTGFELPRVAYGGHEVPIKVTLSRAPLAELYEDAMRFDLVSSDPAVLAVPATITVLRDTAEAIVMARAAETAADTTVTVLLSRSGGAERRAIVTVRPIPPKRDQPRRLPQQPSQPPR